MDCNIKCYWNYNGMCCPEDEESCDNAKPNDNNCPTYLRKDFEEELHNTLDECKLLLKFRDYEQLCKIRDFIKSQEETDVLYQIENYIKNNKRLKGFYIEDITKQFKISKDTAKELMIYFEDKGLIKIEQEVVCINCGSNEGFKSDIENIKKITNGNFYCSECGELIDVNYLDTTRNYYEIVR